MYSILSNCEPIQFETTQMLLFQGSLVFPRTPLVVDTGNSRMAARNVDENIYHWKILNVSNPCVQLVVILLVWN